MLFVHHLKRVCLWLRYDVDSRVALPSATQLKRFPGEGIDGGMHQQLVQ